jgi:hypothetical protein
VTLSSARSTRAPGSGSSGRADGVAQRSGILLGGWPRFYQRLGWEVTGRWPGALRLAPGDDRDEILMILTPL